MPSPVPAPDPGSRAARRRILEAAADLFRSPGINATGVNELAAAARVSKRTLYQYFPSKDEVIIAYLREADEDTAPGPERVLARTDLSPRARLLELFAHGDARRPLRGDPFVNAAVEFPDPRHPVHALAADHKRRFARRLTDIAREAGARDPEHVARRLTLLYDGMAAQAVVSDDPEAASLAYAMAAAVLHQAID